MSCSELGFKKPDMECNGIAAVKKYDCIYFVKATDIVINENGDVLRLKRKYGKFSRPVFKVDLSTYERI